MMLVVCSGQTQAQLFDNPNQRRSPSTIFPDVPPPEPTYNKVTYLKIPEPGSLRERIDQILNGITNYVRPEYDHYGYEIRYYMAHVAGPEVLKNRDKIIEQLNNINNARIVLKYWKQHLNDQIKEIETTIEENDATSRNRTTFKYNKAVVNAFLSELENWIDNNEKFLEFLSNRQGKYEIDYPKITFEDRGDLTPFKAHYDVREKSLRQIQTYVPFANMVY